MKFKFKAKDETGKFKEGFIDAASLQEANLTLQKNKLTPLLVEEVAKKSELEKAIVKALERVTPKELVVFFRQLAILVEARVPITLALSAINEQTTNNYFRRIISEISADVDGGTPFSDSLEKHKDVFSSLSINIIRSGEASGNLKKSVEYVADNIERNYNLSNKVKSALLYPAIVMVVFFIIGFITVSFIVPKLTQIIKDLNADVPWYTQLVIAIGDFMSQYWWAVLIIIIGMILAVYHYLHTEEGRKEWDQMKIHLPIVGVIFRYVYITRFSENLGVLLAGGIPIIRSLEIVSSVVNNVVYEKIFLDTAERVKMGGNMSDVFRKSPLIPPMVTQMVKIGEESGQIDSVLGHITKFYDQEVDLMTKNLSTLIEPVLMIIIGFGVGFMAFAILMPIYNIAGQIK